MPRALRFISPRDNIAKSLLNQGSRPLCRTSRRSPHGETKVLLIFNVIVTRGIFTQECCLEDISNYRQGIKVNSNSTQCIPHRFNNNMESFPLFESFSKITLKDLRIIYGETTITGFLMLGYMSTIGSLCPYVERNVRIGRNLLYFYVMFVSIIQFNSVKLKSV